MVEASLLDDSPLRHDQEAIGKAGLDFSRVADEQERDVQLLLQLAKQGQKFGLAASVERGGRLIGNYKLRLASQGLREKHALALPSAELMWIGRIDAVRWWEAYPGNH